MSVCNRNGGHASNSCFWGSITYTMKIELVSKEFKLKETQFQIDPFKNELSETEILGLKGQSVILIDLCDDLAMVRNDRTNWPNYYTLWSNLE